MNKNNTIFEGLRTFFLREKATPWLSVASIYILLAPNVDFVAELSWHDGQRLAQLAIFGVTGFAAFFHCIGRSIWATWDVVPNGSRYLLGLALVAGLISSVCAEYPRWAFLEWSTLVMVGVLAFAVSASWRTKNPGRDEILIIVFYATALVYSVKAATMYVTMIVAGPEYGLGFSVEELFTGFSSVRFFGHVQTMLLPFLILPVIWWGKTNGQRFAMFIVPAVWWMLAIASGTRGSWVALLAGAVAVVFLGGKTGRFWCRWQIGGLLSGAVLYVFFVLLLPTWLSLPVTYLHRNTDFLSLRGREVLWALSERLVLQHPWLGVGPMHFANRVSELGAHPHNAVLQLMVEWGIPAALLFSSVFAIGVMSWGKYVYRHTANKAPDKELLAMVSLLAAIIGAGIQAMVDGIIVMPVSQTLVALICGWALGWRLKSAQRPTAPASATGMSFRCFVLLAMIGIVLGITPEMGHLAERERQHLIKQPEGPNPRLLPRFWLHGLIPK